MKAEIITSGTEILLGNITDTNTRFIASQLAMLGIDLYYTSTVGDNYERFSSVLKQAWERSDLVIITGGLGPTKGDITREVIAGLMGEEMTVDPDMKSELVEFFSRRGIEMPENNLKQATLIPSAEALRNPSGTAPGWWVEKDGRIILSMPGPPGEMQNMWRGQVLPRLREKSGAVILSRTLKTWGLTEAKVDEMVTPYLSADNPTLALYAKADGINLRITAKAATEETASMLISERERDLRGILGQYIWGVDDESLEGMVGKLLKERGMKLAVTESFTGGMLAHALTSNPESRGCFKGSVVTPMNDSEVNGETTSSMARRARTRFQADIGMAVDGYYDSETAPAIGDVFIAVDTEADQGVITPGYPGNPQLVIRRTISHALVYLREFILKQKDFPAP
jgi:nicotinamide-nucleotide amidase